VTKIPQVRGLVSHPAESKSANWFLEPLFRSEPAKFSNAANGRTKPESSEERLNGKAVTSDFDSAIRRFDPSRPSQPLTRPEIVVNFNAKCLHFAGIFAYDAGLQGSQNPQLWRESPKSLQPQPQKFPFWRRPLAETGSITLRGRSGSAFRSPPADFGRDNHPVEGN